MISTATKKFRLDKNFIKRYADFHTVVDALGVEQVRHGANIFIRCPNPQHNDEHIGNCVLYDDGCYCHACGKGYDVIGIARAVLGCSMNDALNYIAGVCGLIGLAESETQKTSFHPENNFIKSEDASFIGIHNCRVKKIIGVSDEERRQEWQQYKLSLRGKKEKPKKAPWREYDEVTVISNPLLDLFKNDRATYRELVIGKAKEKARALYDSYLLVLQHQEPKEPNVKKYLSSCLREQLTRCERIIELAKKA